MTFNVSSSTSFLAMRLLVIALVALLLAQVSGSRGTRSNPGACMELSTLYRAAPDLPRLPGLGTND